VSIPSVFFKYSKNFSTGSVINKSKRIKKATDNGIQQILAAVVLNPHTNKRQLEHESDISERSIFTPFQQISSFP